MQLRDVAFEHTFQRLFVYNILFEDAEVDETHLGVDERSRVLSITGAGCGVAGMLSRDPRSIDAVDINPHHLALTALKCTAAKSMRSYSRFYDLCGRGWQPDPERTIATLARAMPSWMQRYWSRHHGRFERSVYREGLTAVMLGAFRRFTGLDAEWLRWAMRLSPDARVAAVDEHIAPVLQSPLARAYFASPAQLVALGINFSQRDRILATEDQPDLAAFVLDHLRRLARTDVATNWFVWWAIAGHFDHERTTDAVPPYLRPDRHARSIEASTDVRYHRANLFDVLERSPQRAYTHYTLCDAPDWMPERTQRRLLDEILRTSEDGAIVLYRSVEDECMATRLGYQRRFVPLRDRTEHATQADRSRQYRAVRFYQVAH
ncbi:DUF3419 family protein [Sandaracinus amylolyticus]|uniref:S-adenosylmethionine diacylglycerol 3-amino-3-carboxypropyl transferase n=1 Tax=Sandaracinus amylolyticus TaxID=927083 RepID=A0A0F6W232_9BACT|nr:DUF3419 family protein [Sandaracinus amylolyticus]AKF05436.1 S-adenosylmethionine diacylglycerol 3-amino-3-carboxypropyl transferase [Sandaracinus amylolyticus]